jgi:16S rRNA (adenine1518-N6/adenine1519-N6)-dimethyltransferase
MTVKPKKHLGQHFLTDQNIAKKIVSSLNVDLLKNVLEIGPGMGVLTKYLLENKDINYYCVEIDTESVKYLMDNFNLKPEQLFEADFLKFDLASIFSKPISIIGNFPYNISSQILFKVLDNRDMVVQVVGMFQKEVAERIVAKPNSKDYGILSILIQAYYSPEILFNVSESVFYPQPKVKSAVISMQLKNELIPKTDFLFFKKVVKSAFQKRRKMLRNSLSEFGFELTSTFNEYQTKRPEQLTYEEFDMIATEILNMQLRK